MIKFSVLMPIGPNADINTFRKAWKSIKKQSLYPNEIIIIFDGLGSSKKKKILEILDNNINLKCYELPKQESLADVLNYGLTKCNHEFVARADADDINFPNRFEIQIKEIKKNDIDIIGSSMKYLIGKKEKIKNQSTTIKSYKFLNPLNHPTVIFNRKKILSIGAYPKLPRFEDYALWLNCIKNNFKINNISKPLVYSFVDKEYFKRRSGFKYFIYEIKFQIYILKKKHINFVNFTFNFFVRSSISLFGKILKPIIFKYLF